MIELVLTFLEQRMNDFMKVKLLTSDTMVKVAGLQSDVSDLDGAKLQISVVNIEEELALSNRVNVSVNQDRITQKKAPLYFNIYVLVSVVLHDKKYKESLKWLSLAIQFFQKHTTFFANAVNMPKGLDKLNFDAINLSIDNMSRFWSAIGEKYRPSVIYKIRMIKIDDDTIDAVLPVLKKPLTTVQK